METLRCDAWLLRGISSIPGELRLQRGRVSFEASFFGNAWPFQLRRLERLLGLPGLAAAMEEGNERVLFDWRADELTAWCPWVYFGGGLELRRGAVTLRFSLGPPANAELNAGSAGSPLALGAAAQAFSEVRAMRRQGRRWLAALAAAKPATRDPA